MLLRILPHTIAASGAAALAGNGAKLWQLDWYWLASAIGVVFLWGVGQPIIRVVQDEVGKKSFKFEQDVRMVLKTTFIRIEEASRVDWKTLSVSAYVLRREKRWGIWPTDEEFLARVWRERFSTPPPSSGIKWTVGKGVIGQCWKERRDVGRNLEQDYGPDRAVTREQWDSAREDFRQGLSYKEFQRANHHGAVVASPMLDENDKFLGCVAVDAPGSCYNQLWDPKVREILQEAALIIRALSKRKG